MCCHSRWPEKNVLLWMQQIGDQYSRWWKILNSYIPCRQWWWFTSLRLEIETRNPAYETYSWYRNAAHLYVLTPRPAQVLDSPIMQHQSVAHMGIVYSSWLSANANSTVISRDANDRFLNNRIPIRYTYNFQIGFNSCRTIDVIVLYVFANAFDLENDQHLYAACALFNKWIQFWICMHV